MMQRARSGSISTRLRSASELEDKGLINRFNKGTVRDMIFSGDEVVGSAIDKFRETGDASEFEGMVKSGAFSQGGSSFNPDLLLEGLDLAVLSMGPDGRDEVDDDDNFDFDDPFGPAFVDNPGQLGSSFNTNNYGMSPLDGDHVFMTGFEFDDIGQDRDEIPGVVSAATLMPAPPPRVSVPDCRILLLQRTLKLSSPMPP